MNGLRRAVLCLLLCCGVSVAHASEEPLVTEGKSLYAAHCACCHQPLERTTKAQRSANRQFPAMARFDALTDEQLQAISAALKTIPLTTN